MTVLYTKTATRSTSEEGDIFPKLFTAALESIFRRLTWETSGLKIGSEYLRQHRFADDILMCANTPHELQQMLQELADESDCRVAACACKCDCNVGD